MHESFDRFLQTAIKDYYERSGAERRGNFVALVIASGEVVPMAAEAVKKSPARNLAAGAVGALALRAGLKWALGGPLGMVVGGLTVASMLAVLRAQQKGVGAKVKAYREVIRLAHSEYDKVQDAHADGKYDDDERGLLIDGLMQRLMRDLDEQADAAEEEAA
jgi:hypothetical protein